MFSFLNIIIGWLGIIISLYLNFIPYFSYKDLIKNSKTINEVSSLVLFFNIVKFSAQLAKGIKMDQLEFCICNIIGLVLSLIWFSIWLFFFAEKKVKPLSLYYFLILDAAVEIFIIFYFLISILYIQIVIMILNIFISLSLIPYKKIFTAIKSGNYTLITMNFLIINIIYYLCWFYYGYYKNDFSIYVDNIINLVLCCLQYIIYFCVKNKLLEIDNYHKELKEEKNEIKVISSINNK